MKLLRSILSLLFAVAFALTAVGQIPTPPQTSKITGQLQITYNTRTQLDGDKPKLGVVDRYQMAINVADSTLFSGTIDHLPFVKRTLGNQQGSLSYDVNVSLYHPTTREPVSVGRLHGVAPVDQQNVYRFADGAVRISVAGGGKMPPLDSAFKGLALGKPPGKSGWLAKVEQKAIQIRRNINGQTVALTITKHDEMQLQNLVLPAGPVQIYPEATVNGKLIYNYGQNSWHFEGVTITYSLNGRTFNDRLSGSIRWLEAPNRKTTGKGSYDFNILVNEPPPSEAAVFAPAASEDAFFAVDNSLPALTGSMAYTDAISNDVVRSSAVQIALLGNQLTKQQLMALTKLVFFTALVPVNAE